MNNTLDFNVIAAAALASSRALIEQWLPGGRYQGDNYIVKNPMRSDEHAGSFSINHKTGYWADFAVSDAKGGDLVSLYAYINGIGQGEAAKQLNQILLAAPQAPAAQNQQNVPMPEKWTVIDPVPADAPPVPAERPVKINSEWVRYKITHYWPYKNQQGQTRLYVVRYETPEGKQTPQMTLQRSDTGKIKWRFKGISGPRPLFNLDKIAHSPGAQVIVVEGEKKASLLQEIIEGSGCAAALVATCWIGGAQAVKKTDWSPLRGRKILLWPDHDDVGARAMQDVIAAIRGAK